MLPEGGAIEVGVEVAATRNFDASDAVDFGEGVGDFLSEEARRFFEALGQLEADGRGGFAHFEFGRTFENDLEGLPVGLRDVASEGVVEAVDERYVHGTSSFRGWLSISGAESGVKT